MRRSAAAPLALVLPALLAGCPKTEEKPVEKPAPFVPPVAVTKRAEEPLPKLRYTDVTAESGITFVHDTGADGRKLLPETVGSGCAIFDYDGDGKDDLLFLSGKPWTKPAGDATGPATPTLRLYRNEGALRFREVTGEAGLGDASIAPYAMGAACADADGDGDQDVFVSAVGGYLFLRNDGGKFRALTAAETGLEPGTWKDSEGEEHGPFATSAAWTDVDLDGRPDLFVCHYVHWSEKTDVFSTMDGKSKSYATPDVYQGESNRLWRNLGPDANGNVRFEDWTDRAKVRNPEGKSLGIAVVEMNGDGRPDLIVANDKQPNYVYCSRADGGFDECGVRTGIANGPDGRARAGMGIDSLLYGEKGRLTIAIGNFSGEPVGFWEWNEKTFVNRSEKARITEATLPSLTFGLRCADADLDGRTDVLIANGHIEPTVQDVHSDIPYKQPLQVLRQLGDGTFLDISKHVGDGVTTPRVHRGLALGDLDGDGDLDIVATVNGAAPVLLRCDLENAAKRSLRVHVAGAAPGTDALGAKVTVTSSVGTQSQWVRSGGSYLCESERTLTFGLGEAGRVSKVVVRWPDGTERTFDGVAPGLLRATR